MESSPPKISVAHSEVFYEKLPTQYRFQILKFGQKAEKYANITGFYKKPVGGGCAPTKKQISLPVAAWVGLEKNFSSFSATVKSFSRNDDATVPTTSSNKENRGDTFKTFHQGMNLSCYGILNLDIELSS